MLQVQEDIQGLVTHRGKWNGKGGANKCLFGGKTLRE